MASTGHKHNKCEIKGCRGRRPVWGYYCKAHREIYGQTPPDRINKPDALTQKGEVRG